MTHPDAAPDPGAPPLRPERIAAMAFTEGWNQWTRIAGELHTPDVIYEVLYRPAKVPNGMRYEARMVCAGTREMLHEDPYTFDTIEELAKWWSTETGLELPEDVAGPPRRRRNGGPGPYAPATATAEGTALDADFAAQEAYYEGFRARTGRRGFPQNPYPPNSTHWRHFHDGVNHATAYLHPDAGEDEG